LLRKAAELFIDEYNLRKFISLNETVVFPLSQRIPTTEPEPWPMIDIQNDVGYFLQRFEAGYAQRAKLASTQQIACFYALLLFGVAKSLLIDAYSIRAEYEESSCWKHGDVARITSAYKAIVSVFVWSSTYDLILEVDQPFESDESIKLLGSTREMIRSSLWNERGIKTTKDFLIGLGSSSSPLDAYNGFFVQRVGFEFPSNSLPEEKSSLLPRSPSNKVSEKKNSGLALELQPNWPIPEFDDTLYTVHVSDKSPKAFQDAPFKSNDSQEIIWHQPYDPHNNNLSTANTHAARRRRALSPKSRSQAAQTRKIGSCIRCSVLKIRVPTWHLVKNRRMSY
jgi:hypothetical protein